MCVDVGVSMCIVLQNVVLCADKFYDRIQHMAVVPLM